MDGNFLQHSRHPIPTAYQELTVDGTVRKLTVPAGAYEGRLKMVDGPANYTLDNATTPSATVGMLMYDLDEKVFNLGELLNAQWIRNGAVNGKLQATYYIRN